MKKTRVIAAALSAAMAVGLLAGCGSTTSGSSVQSSAAASGSTAGQEPVTIRFGWWGGDSRHEATLAVIDQFEAEYPWITVEAEYGGNDGYHDKLATQLTSGTAPDIVQVDPEIMPQYVNEGDYFVDYLETDFDFSNFDMAYLESSTITGNYDGHQYGLPTGVAGPCVLVNKELADAIGADFTKPYTWDDLITWGKAAREYGEDTYLLSTNADYLNNMVVNYYHKQLTGNTLFDVETGKLLATEESLTATFDYVKSLFDNEVVAPVTVMSQYSGDNLQNDPAWIDGKYASSFTYISTAEVLTAANPDAEYYAGEFPMLEDAKNPGWIIGCPQILAVTKTTENLDACILFLDYFYNDDTALATLGVERSLPPTEHAREIVEAEGKASPLLSQAVEILTPYEGLNNDPIGSSAEAKQAMIDAISQIAYGQLSTSEAAQQVMSLYKDLEK
jgi:oligogalacturonide transport system substrate-binding protein